MDFLVLLIVIRENLEIFFLFGVNSNLYMLGLSVKIETVCRPNCYYTSKATFHPKSPILRLIQIFLQPCTAGPVWNRCVPSCQRLRPQLHPQLHHRLPGERQSVFAAGEVTITTTLNTIMLPWLPEDQCIKPLSG